MPFIKLRTPVADRWLLSGFVFFPLLTVGTENWFTFLHHFEILVKFLSGCVAEPGVER